MSLQFLKAGTADAVSLMCISKKAFDSDVEVGASSVGGPPGYNSLSFHTKMARMNCLYKLVDDYKIVGGALLFLKDNGIEVPRVIGWDFPNLSQEQINVFNMHGYTAALIMPDGVLPEGCHIK